MNLTVERIVSLISEKGIMAKTFMDDLNLNKSSVSDWKAGKSESYIKYLNKIAEYFNVSIDYLLGNTDMKNKPIIDKDDELKAKFYEVVKDFSPEDVEQMLDYARYLISKRDK